MWKLTAWIKRDHNPYLADGRERRMYKGTGDTKNMTQPPRTGRYWSAGQVRKVVRADGRVK